MLKLLTFLLTYFPSFLLSYKKHSFRTTRGMVSFGPNQLETRTIPLETSRLGCVVDVFSGNVVTASSQLTPDLAILRHFRILPEKFYETWFLSLGNALKSLGNSEQ